MPGGKTMKKGILSLLLVLFVFSSACIGNIENTHTSCTSVSNGSANSTYPLTDVPYGVIELDTLADYGDVTVVQTTYGYVILRNNTKVFLNVSEAYFFPWGFVIVKTVPDTRSIPIVNASFDRNYTEDSRNITAMIGVTKIEAYDYGGHILWVHESQPPYIWELKLGRGYQKKGISYPKVLISNSTDYLFVAEFSRSFGNSITLPSFTGNTGNCLCIYGKEGIVRRFEFEKKYEVENEFLQSLGDYTVLGFQVPCEDGSPEYGRIMIFKGSEIIFTRSFERDPTCLCNVIHGWARITPDGCVFFGLFNGYGFYCRGNFKYFKNEKD